jgi:AP-2 complex subunit sigma-1
MAQYRDNKIVYRRYAGLFFSLCVDVSDNELAYLEAIHLLVELLDQFFGNVCELDLVFNFHKVRLLLFVTPPQVGACVPKFVIVCLSTAPLHLFVPVPFQVYTILDEYILAGEIQDTSKKMILERMQALE